MNGPHRENPRIRGEDTPEARLAAVVKDLVDRMKYPDEAARAKGIRSRVPDYADFRDTLLPWVTREILLVRAEEARQYGDEARARELDKTADP